MPAVLAGGCFSYAALKQALEKRSAARAAEPAPNLTQTGPDIRDITEYQAFWETHSRTHSQENTHAHVDH